MPQFRPAEERVAVVTFPVSPAGLDCTAELWLGSDTVKVATSGAKPFISTGVAQSLSLPITMPATEGTYPVCLDIFVAGQLIGAYQAIEDVVIALKVVPGWVVDNMTTMSPWNPLASPYMWSNIFREEYKTTSRGIYTHDTGTGHLTDGCMLGEPPYLLPECVGKSETVWVVEGLRYRVYTLLGAGPYGASVTVEQHWLGLDSVEGRNYWKTQIPVGVPVAFGVFQGEVGDDVFRELESAGVADVTNVYPGHSVNWRPYFRVIIYDIDGFFDILRKYQWQSITGKIVE